MLDTAAEMVERNTRPSPPSEKLMPLAALPPRLTSSTPAKPTTQPTALRAVMRSVRKA